MLTVKNLIRLGLVTIIFCTGCSRHDHVVNQYQKDGVNFLYDSDWSITKDAPIKGKPNARAIDIDDPDQAIIAIICVPPASDQTLEEFAAAVAEYRGTAIGKKLSLGGVNLAAVDPGTSEQTTGNIAGQEVPGILQRFSIDLAGVQVPHEVRFFMVRGTKYKLLITCSVATENAASARPAFELILKTLAVEGFPYNKHSNQGLKVGDSLGPSTLNLVKPLVITMLICYLIGSVGAIWILIEAFKVSVLTGILAFIIPYKIYFAFAKLRHPRKSLILSLWLGGGCAGIIFNIILAAKYG